MDVQVCKNFIPKKETQWAAQKTKDAGGKTSFQTAVESRRKGNPKDSIVISGGSVANRLKQLDEISKNIDYTGMSDEEIYRSIEDRYEKAFPCWTAMYYYDTDNYDRIVDQKIAEAQKVIGNKANNLEFRQRAYGYEGMSAEEMKSAILKKYPGSSPISRTAAIIEMGRVGAMDIRTGDKLCDNIWRNLEKKACAARGLHWEKDQCYNNPLRKQWAYALAQTTSLSWGAILDEFTRNDKLDHKTILSDMEKLNDTFDEFIKKEKGLE